jgi:hypothetical protein
MSCHSFRHSAATWAQVGTRCEDRRHLGLVRVCLRRHDARLCEDRRPDEREPSNVPRGDAGIERPARRDAPGVRHTARARAADHYAPSPPASTKHGALPAPAVSHSSRHRANANHEDHPPARSSHASRSGILALEWFGVTVAFCYSSPSHHCCQAAALSPKSRPVMACSARAAALLAAFASSTFCTRSRAA